jgi:hypothetical protein
MVTIKSLQSSMVGLSSDDEEGEELPLHMPYSNTFNTL